MCCKGAKKCFGEQSLMVVRVDGTIMLLAIGEIARTPHCEFVTKTGQWSPLSNAEFIGLGKVVKLPEWPLYLTPDHKFADGTKAADHGKLQKDKQLVYALTCDAGDILAGPFFVKVLQPAHRRDSCAAKEKSVSANRP